jgi:hypothetical protein
MSQTFQRPKRSVLRAVSSVGCVAAVGIVSIVSSSTPGHASSIPTAAAVDSAGSTVMRSGLVVGVVILILGQLWILSRRVPPQLVPVPLLDETRRNRLGSSTIMPKSSTEI